MEKYKYKLVGLSKPASATLEHLDNDRDTFWAVIDMTPDRISALWELCKGDWNAVKIAEIECDRLSEDGTPINARMVGIQYK